MKNRAGNVLARPISPPIRGRIRVDGTHREAVERIHAICGKRPSPVDGYFNGLLDIRVQPGGSGAAQQLISYGANRGVTVRIKVYP